MSLIPFGFWGSKAEIPLTGLKMYLNFEGNVTTDLAGVLNPTVFGCTYNSGNGGYLIFDGVNDYVNTNRTSNGSDIGIYYGSWSIAYCVRFPNVTGVKDVFGSSTSPGPNAQSGANNATLIYRQNNNNSPIYSSISANTWYHVVNTYDYASYTPKIYVNGVLQATGFQERMTGAGWTVYLGRTNSTYYALDLGLAMIYNRVLIATEITDIFNNQKGRFEL
jgi:hypothetical protein